MRVYHAYGHIAFFELLDFTMEWDAQNRLGERLVNAKLVYFIAHRKLRAEPADGTAQKSPKPTDDELLECLSRSVFINGFYDEYGMKCAHNRLYLVAKVIDLWSKSRIKSIKPRFVKVEESGNNVGLFTAVLMT